MKSVGCLVGCVAVLLSPKADADVWDVGVTDSTYMQIYSNPLYTNTNAQSVTVEGNTPTIWVDTQRGPYSFQALASLNLLHSSDPQALVNRVDPNVSLTAGWETERSRLNLTLDYNLTTTLPVATSPVPVYQPSGQSLPLGSSAGQTSQGAGSQQQTGSTAYIAQDATQITRTLIMDWQFDINERWSSDVKMTTSSVTINQAGLPASQTSIPSLYSYTQNVGVFTLTRAWTPVFATYLQVLLGQMRVNGQSGQDAWQSALVGAKWEINDNWSMESNVGMTNVQNGVFMPGYYPAQPSAGTLGFNDMVLLQWQNERNWLSGENQKTYLGSSYGGVGQIDTTSVDYRHQFTERCSGGFDETWNTTNATYFQSTQRVSDIWLSQELSPHADVRLLMQHIDFGMPGIGMMGNNVVGITLNYTNQ